MSRYCQSTGEFLRLSPILSLWVSANITRLYFPGSTVAPPPLPEAQSLLRTELMPAKQRTCILLYGNRNCTSILLQAFVGVSLVEMNFLQFKEKDR